MEDYTGMKRLSALTALVFLLAGCAIANRMSGISEEKRLQEVGESARATIIAISDTGMTLNDDPVVRLRVTIHRAAGDDYEAEIPKSVISRVHIPQFQPGHVVPVRVDPVDRARVALDVYKRN
jgi:hypothetical protein